MMSYGTSLFASLGLMLSFSLGRNFIAKTERNDSLKQQYIFSFLVLNGLSTIVTAVLGCLFWYFSASAQKILDLDVLLPLMATSVFYVWTVNGNSLFAAFQNTKKQEWIILTTRLLLILFLAVYLLLDSKNFVAFLSIYSAILGFGVFAEWILLRQTFHWPKRLLSSLNLRSALSGAWWPHIDFLAFYIYPLVLIIFAGQYLEKSGVGRVNFALQLVSLVFLLSTTANIRVNAYVSNFGYKAKIPQIKKLFWGTLFLSFFLALAASPALGWLTLRDSFSSFQGVGSLFAIATLAIPGYLMYHFLNPLWLEAGLMRTSALLNLLSTSVACALSPFLISHMGESGAIWGFTIFHSGCLVNQFIIYGKFRRREKTSALNASYDPLTGAIEGGGIN
jgi:O-antigen/teichoic acid export membrane protein